MLYDHYDVQPVDPLDEWSTLPFEPDVRDGRLYARGAADDKGALVARLCALEAYRACRGALPLGIVWVIEGDEEIGSPHLESFVERYADVLRGACGCVWEGGGRDARDRYTISLGCKGLLYVELRARGASHDGHSARAAVIPNPAWRLVWALRALKGPDGHVLVPGFYDDVRPISDEQRRALARWDYPEKENLAINGLDRFLDGLSGERLKEQLVFGPTCNVAGFHAGYGGPGAKTVLPAEAVAKVDFRLVPDQDPARVLALLRTHLAEQGFVDVEVVDLSGERPSVGDPAHPFSRAAAQAAESVYGHRPALVPMMSGTGPIHLLCGQFGVPVATAGVGHAGSHIHGPDENVRVADFISGVHYVVALLEVLWDMYG